MTTINMTAHAIGHQLRSTVVSRATSSARAREELATALDVPLSSVDRLLEQAVWDLDLALRCADALGIEVHVVER